MKDRIRQIMESQHMTQTVFAQFIEVSPASLSSIFNGRTKPTLPIMEAIKKKIPNINLEWLMLGSGSMFMNQEGDRSTAENASTPTHVMQESLFDFTPPSVPTPESSSSLQQKNTSVRSTRLNTLQAESRIIDNSPRRVTEIRVFYDDQTWESF